MGGRNKRAAQAFVRKLTLQLLHGQLAEERLYRGPALGLYTLRGREPIQCHDPYSWRIQPIEERRVARTEIGVFTVFTSFIGIDHNFDFHRGGDPLLFETMVEYERSRPLDLDFVPEWLGLRKLYATWEQAEDGHARVVLFVRHNYDLLCKRPDIEDRHEEN